MPLTLLGCAFWIPIEGNYVSRENFFEVDLPAGWKRAYFTREGLTLTRDGVPLQVVQIVRTPPDKELPFTNRRLEKGMLPQEIAEITIDSIRSNRNFSNVQVFDNEVATVGGYPGFKISFSFQTKESLKKQVIYYGVVADKSFYRILLEAPARHYFPRALSDLEFIRQTFKIKL